MKIVNENYTYARVAKYIKDRKAFTEEQVEGLEEIVMDSAKAKAIWDASRSSMGKRKCCCFCILTILVAVYNLL